jgi:hypothetical protein
MEALQKLLDAPQRPARRLGAEAAVRETEYARQQAAKK